MGTSKAVSGDSSAFVVADSSHYYIRKIDEWSGHEVVEGTFKVFAVGQDISDHPRYLILPFEDKFQVFFDLCRGDVTISSVLRHREASLSDSSVDSNDASKLDSLKDGLSILDEIGNESEVPHRISWFKVQVPSMDDSAISLSCHNRSAVSLELIDIVEEESLVHVDFESISNSLDFIVVLRLSLQEVGVQSDKYILNEEVRDQIQIVINDPHCRFLKVGNHFLESQFGIQIQVDLKGREFLESILF
mmetsp:Transcript_30555/g.29989  ORF Transcript_30555/g.29989 Transcript_30555/m.29989 type:complete len:247 (+) Transcript_30555:320-1060(+)